jgi:hypothetical protein
LILDSHEAATTRLHNDQLLYPTIYLYRHCLELKLKDLILLGVRCGNFKLDDVREVVGGHGLCPLWTKVKQFLQIHCPDDKDQIKVVEAVVQEFHQIDRDGQTMRYDRDKELRKRKYKQVPSHINVRNLRGTMDEVYNYLDSRYGGILDWSDAGN